jgi:hypothetical protein
MTRADILTAFETAKTAKDLLRLESRIADYRDTSKDPTAQAVYEAIRALCDARRDFESALHAWEFYDREYRTWAETMRLTAGESAGQLPSNIRSFPEYQLHERRERVYIIEERGYNRVRGMAEQLMMLWAAMDQRSEAAR